jgi:16S rRNA (cytidine1402-2'-O)-methyltransferase
VYRFVAFNWMKTVSDDFAVLPGRLYVVATPIGNLSDLTSRAQKVLATVNVIAAEDTRHTSQLLQAVGVSTPLVSMHEHNEARRSAELIERLLAGDSVAVVSDAGTPLISDPGFDVVAAARARSVEVIAIPGACAAIAALSIAGLPSDRFVFEGFLPAKNSAREAALHALMKESRTMIFYEAPHRLVETLTDMRRCLGAERVACVARELTKRFESSYFGTLSELCERAAHDPDMSRGEIVIVVGGFVGTAEERSAMDADQVLRALLEDLPPSQAAKIAARLTKLKRSELYERAMDLAGKK